MARELITRASGIEQQFQSRCRDWVVGEVDAIINLSEDLSVSVSLPRLGGWRVRVIPCARLMQVCFSLVAEIGWLARSGKNSVVLAPYAFQSRCRDWVVGELDVAHITSDYDFCLFQSRCRDWVVGERLWGAIQVVYLEVSVSLPRLGGWRVPIHHGHTT